MYVKPYVKRQKNDANDACAIVEAAQRPTMRFVTVRTEEEQARSVLFRSRELLVRQRTQTINALRGHLAEFGLVVPLGIHNVERLEEAFAACEEHFPAPAPAAIRLLVERIDDLNAEIDELDREIRRIVRDDEKLTRLMTIPGVGELTAMAVHAGLPLAGFRLPRARHRQDFPCCYAFHLPCMPTPLPRRKPAGALVALFPAGRRPSPNLRRVGFRDARIEACSAFTFVPACMVARPPKAALLSKVLQPMSLPP